MKKFMNLVKIARPLIPMVTGRGLHFSFILNRNKVLCMGFAQAFKTNPMANKYGHRFNAIHSELHAILRFPFPPRELRNCTMVNIRFLRDGSLSISRPCGPCQRLLADFEMGEVWYTNRAGKFEFYEPYYN
jgi:hypothetical protein